MDWRNRLKLVLAGAAATLTACSQQSPDGPVAAINCELANHEVFDCVEANPKVRTEARWDLCIPHSEQLLLTGVWVTDFEWNQFHEDAGEMPPSHTLNDYHRYNDLLPELSGEPLRDINKGEGAAIVRVRLLGRRPLCDPYPDLDRILVDEVISWDVLSDGESGSITFGPGVD